MMIPPVNIRWQGFSEYSSILNSNFCPCCILTRAKYIFIHVHAPRKPLLAVLAAWWSGSVLGGVVVLLSLRDSVGEEGPIWGQFGTPSNRRPRQASTADFSDASWRGQLESQVTVRSQVCQICASQEFLEYRHPGSVPSHYSFQESKPPKI